TRARKPREYLLLEYFARNEGRVVTRTMLLEGVWDYHFDPGTNVIDVHVSRLRRKLDDGSERPLLHTGGVAGYRVGMASWGRPPLPADPAILDSSVHRTRLSGAVSGDWGRAALRPA